MHIITQARIWEAKKRHPESATSLDGWYRAIKHNKFSNFAWLKHTFNSVDKVDDHYIFNIGGNKLRLITNINFKTQKVFVRYILTHSAYDKNKWKSR